MQDMLDRGEVGKKKITFHEDDEYYQVVKKLELAYSRLKEVGGFLLYRAKEGGTNRPLSQLTTI